MKNSIILFLLFSCFYIFSQKIEFANAPNGLVIRDSPNLNSNRIGKLDYGTRVMIIDKTNITLEIKDEGKIITGKWTKVKDLINNQIGYVFSGFLTNEALDKETESNGYYLTKIKAEDIMKFEENLYNSKKPKPVHFFLRDSKHRSLNKVEVSEVLLYDDTTLYVKELYGLKNLKQLIRIESNYDACCSNTEEYYFLVDLTDNLIALPQIQNVHCDGPEPYFSYIFPMEKNGKEEKIIYAKITPNQENNNDTVEILKVYSWNGIKTTVEK